MKEIRDVFIKDEGDFFTLGFQTEKAKKVFEEQIKNNPTFDDDMAYGKEVIKMDFPNENLNVIRGWIISWDLSWEES